MAALEAGGEIRAMAIKRLMNSVVRESFDVEGCWTVQRALELGTQQEAIELAWNLRGHVRDAIESPFANHVLQKVILVLPPSSVEFIVKELRNFGVVVARHRFGCRILSRILEHQGLDENAGALIDEVLEDAEDLSLHQFGHYVMEHVLEHGQAHQRKRIAEALLRNVLDNAVHRNGSHVFEKALLYAPDEDRDALVEAVLATPGSLLRMGESQFGNFVVRALLQIRGEASDRVRDFVRAEKAKLQSSKYGRRILESPGRAA